MRKHLPNTTALSLIVISLLASTNVLADDEATVNAVETRQGIFKLVRAYFGPIYGMVRGQVEFDAATVNRNATKIAELADMIPDGFRTNTAGADVLTESLDGIWDDIEDFNAKAATLVERANALAEASAGGLDATRKAFGGMGQACKACHDDYREQN